MQTWNKYLYVSIILCLCSQVEAQELKTWYTNSELAKILMPIESYGFVDFPDTLHWEIKVRIEDSSADPLMIILRKYYSGDVNVTTIQVLGKPLQDQVSDIMSANPMANITKVANRIKLRHTKIDDKKYPALLKLAEEYESLSIKAILPDVLRMHGTEYNILSESLYGNNIQILYNGPGPDANVQEVPVIDWVERLRRLVDDDGK